MTRTNRLRLSALACLLLLPMRGVTRSQAVPKQVSDSISGTWSDACSCTISCPCWQTGRANVRHCLNVQVFQPNANASNPPNTKTTFVVVGSSEGYWAPSQSQYTLYVDNSEDIAMIRKLSKFFQAYYGIDPLAPRRATIEMEVSRQVQHLKIPGILNYKIEPIPQATLSQGVRDYLYDWLVKPEQWRTKTLSYRPAGGHAVGYKGTNSLIAEFHITPENLQAARPIPASSLLHRVANGSGAHTQGNDNPPSSACGGTNGPP
jgi:hypothetical protein